MYELENQIWNTRDPEFLALNPHFHGREGYGIRMMWPEWGTGAFLALTMMETAQELGLMASANDVLQICEVSNI